MNIPTPDLRAALKALAPAISNSPLVPQLAGVLVEANETSLRLSASDHQTWITRRIDVLGGEPWSVTVSHRLLSQIANVARGSEVELTPEGAVLRVTSGRAYWLAPTMVGDPIIWPETPMPWFAINAAEFASAVATIGLAADDDPAKTPALDVIEIKATPAGGVDLIATNRYRVHAVHLDVPATNEGISYPEAASLVAGTSSLVGTVSLYCDGGSGLLMLADTVTTIAMRTKAITKWLGAAKMLKTWQAKILASTTLQAPDLIAAIKGAAVGAQDGQPVTLTASVGEFVVAGADVDSGAAGSVPIDSAIHDGPGLVMVLNPDVILPTLARLGDTEVMISWTSPTTPALLNAPNNAGTFAVMPLAITGARWLEDAVA